MIKEGTKLLHILTCLFTISFIMNLLLIWTGRYVWSGNNFQAISLFWTNRRYKPIENTNGMGLLDVAWVQGADSECTYNSHKTTKRKTGHIAIQSNKTVNSSRQMQTLLVPTFMLFCRSSISVGNEKKLLTSQPLLYCLTLWKWLMIIGKKSCLGSGYQFLSFKPHKRLETNSLIQKKWSCLVPTIKM